MNKETFTYQIEDSDVMNLLRTMKSQHRNQLLNTLKEKPIPLQNEWGTLTIEYYLPTKNETNPNPKTEATWTCWTWDLPHAIIKTHYTPTEPFSMTNSTTTVTFKESP